MHLQVPAAPQQAAAAVKRPVLLPRSMQKPAQKAEGLLWQPGFWKTQKMPARDPAVGGVRVRTDLLDDTTGRCLHCMSPDHMWGFYYLLCLHAIVMSQDICLLYRGKADLYWPHHLQMSNRPVERVAQVPSCAKLCLTARQIKAVTTHASLNLRA